MLRNIVRYRFCLNANPLAMMYPFEYTAKVQQFKFYDPRFSEYPAARKLYQKEIDHIHQTIQNFNRLLNSSNIKLSNDKLEYIHPILQKRVSQCHQLFHENDIKIKYELDAETLNESKGYLEYYGIKPKDHSNERCIHEFDIEKKSEKLRFTLKEQFDKKQAGIQDDQEFDPADQEKRQNQQLKEDVEGLLGDKSFGKKLKERILGDQAKKAEKVFEVADFILSLGQRKIKANNFEQYVHVDRIDGKMSVQINANGQIFQHKNIALITKWLYLVDSNQPEAIRKSRKRILFDFQLWNRGSFVPIKDFTI